MRVIDKNGLVYDSPNELYHHGILGMHWGVRHDHYPLNASEHTATEKKAGWQDSLSERQQKKLDKYKFKQMKDISKRYDKRIARADSIAEAQKERSTITEAKNPNSDRLKKKNAQLENELDFNAEVLKVMKKKEVEAVMKMDYKAMKAEKKEVMRNRIANILNFLDSKSGKDYINKEVTTTEVKQKNRLGGYKESNLSKMFTGGRWAENRWRDEYYRQTRGGRYKYNANDYAKKAAQRNKKYVESMRSRGMTYAQIAKKLGISESSVGYYLNA